MNPDSQNLPDTINNTKKAIEAGVDFIEVFVDCSLEEAEKCDPKGLYKKARTG